MMKKAMRKISFLLMICLILSSGQIFNVNALQLEQNNVVSKSDTIINEIFIESESKSECKEKSDSMTSQEGNFNIIEKEQTCVVPFHNEVYFEQCDTIHREYLIKNAETYDSIAVNYFSTSGIQIESQSNEFKIQTDGKFNISFSTSSELSENDDYLTYQEDRILANIEFKNNGMVEKTEQINIWTLDTPYGTFISDIDPIQNRRKYNLYLLQNEIIDSAVYKDLDRLFHCEEDFNNQQKLKSESLESPPIFAPSATKQDYVEVNYNIISFTKSLTISGNVYWYDHSGTQFPAQYVKVSIIDEDVQFDDILADVITDEYGGFSVNVDNQTFLTENGCDIFLKVYCGNDTLVYDFGSFNFLPSGIIGPLVSYNVSPYYFTTSVIKNIKSTSYHDLHGYATGLIAESFSIGNALYYAREYEKYINGGSCLNNIDVKLFYPLPFADTSFTLPVLDMGSILLHRDDYGDWGTIIHEYGHALEDKLEIFIGYEKLFTKNKFQHFAEYNLTNYYEGDKDKGLKISWNEGWASFYSLCVQRYFSLESKGYPGASSTSIWGYNLVNGTFHGEDHELAVAALLVNTVSQNIMSESNLWRLVKEKQPQSIRKLVDLIDNKLTENMTPETFNPTELNRFSMILEKHNFSAKVLSANNTVSTACPTFTWDEPSPVLYDPNGFQYNYQYRVLIIRDDFIYFKFLSLVSGTSYTASVDEWNNIIAACPNGFYWTVLTYESTSPENDGYHCRYYHYTPSTNISSCGNRYFTLKTNPEKTATDGSIVPSKTNTKWYEFTAPVTATYIFSTTGSVDTYGELFNSVCSDYEYSTRIQYNDDSGAGNNFAISRSMNAGDSIYIRIRGYSSASVGSITFNVKIDATPISTANCTEATISSGGQNWYSFTPQISGRYTVCSTGYTDTVCDMYSSSGSLLEQDDDDGVSINFSITRYLSGGITYYFRIRGYSNSTNGDYQVYIVPTPAMEVNSSHSNTLDAGISDWYLFRAPTTGFYVFYTEGDTDTIGRLYSDLNPKNDANSRLIMNDDGGDNFNFYITYELEINQQVYLSVSGFNEVSAGDYTVHIEYIPTKIVWDQVFNPMIKEGNYIWYEFVAPFTGEFLFYTVGNVDTVCELYSDYSFIANTTYRLAFDDNSGEKLNAAIYYNLNEGQTVYLRVKGYSSSSSGRISVSVYCDHVVEYGYNDISHILDAGEELWYKFTATESDRHIFFLETYWQEGSYELYSFYHSSDLSSRDGYQKDENRIAYEMVAGETVYIRIKNLGDGIMIYTLTISIPVG